MYKRSAPSSLVEQTASKKLKLDDAVDTTATPVTSPSATATSPLETIEPTASDTIKPTASGNIEADAPTDAAVKEDEAAPPEPVDPAAPGTINANAPAEAVTKENETPEEVAKPQAKGKGKTKAPPVAEGFEPCKPQITDPQPSQWWGLKPTSNDPLPHPDQLSARSSGAAVNPPLWEDRGFRYKRGSRYVKYFGPIAPDNVDALPATLDQQTLLVIKLIDMRPKSKNDPSPRRKPVHYVYEHGLPRDWNSLQSVKALNDRRQQAIDRITCDLPFTRIEREYLAQLTETFPEASIWELTSRFNDHFMGQEFTADTALDVSELSQGRTTESVRHQYMTYKIAYDKGEAPTGVRFRWAPNEKAVRAKVAEVFGPPSKALEKEFDETSGVAAHDEDDDAADGQPKATPKKTTKKVTPKKLVEPSAPVIESNAENEPVLAPEDHPKLSDTEEQLLELAGFYDKDGESRAPVAAAPVFLAQAALDFDWISDSPLSDIPSSLSAASNSALTETAAEAGPVEALTEEVQQQESQTVSQAIVLEEVPVVTETTETHVDVQVQVQVASTSLDAGAPTAQAPSLPAARHFDLDENYDDEYEDEEL